MPLDLRKLAKVANGIAHLLENPDEYERFKARFAGAAKETAYKLAQEGGASQALLDRLKRDLGL